MARQYENWDLIPINGGTGQAYMGLLEDRKVFFKRNTSPFIAVLSAEGFAPKLMWTQRTFSGDILTAQEWYEKRELTAREMPDPAVTQLIRSVHDSDLLLMRLQQIKTRPTYPLDFIELYFRDLPETLARHDFFNRVIEHLEDSVGADFYQVELKVCHGDINHNNILRIANDQLLFVDWEDIRIADPVSDLTYFLCQYVRPSQWVEWLIGYDFDFRHSYYERIRWYSLINCLFLIKRFYQENNHFKLNETVLLLKAIYKNKQ